MAKIKGVVAVIAITMVLLIAYADIDWLYPYMLFVLGIMMILYGVLELKEKRKSWAITSFVSAFLILGLLVIKLVS